MTASHTLVKKVPWKHITDIRQQGLQYIEDRRDGKIKSYRTPWARINKVLLQGLDWHSCLTAAGRPGTGKTVFLDMMTNGAVELNRDMDYAVLKFQFEVPELSSGPREFSAETGLTMRQLYSADLGYKVTDADLERIRQFIMHRKNDKIYQVSDSTTVKRMEAIIEQFYREMGKIPLVIGIDHTVLVNKGIGEGSQLDILNELAKMIIRVKKALPVIFIVLSQMNRELERPERRNPGTIGNHPNSGDIFGADALMQCSDIVLAMTRPGKLNIPLYGPYKIIVTPDLIPVHLIKSRVSGDVMTFFKDDLKHFRLLEAEKLPMQAPGADRFTSDETLS